MLKRLLIFIPVVLALVSCEDTKVDEGAVNLVTVEAGTGGTASADVKSAAAGQEVTLTASAEDGYEFAGWVVTSGNLELEDAMANPLTFVMPDAAVSFRATFLAEEVETYDISVTGTAGGDVNYGARASATDPDIVSRPASVAAGYQVALSATPDEGYKFVEWRILEGNVEDLSSYYEPSAVFTMPAEEVAVEAVFEEALYSLIVDETQNGTIEVSVNGGLELDALTAGTIVSLTAVPDDGFKFIRWEMDGYELSEDSIVDESLNIRMPGNDVTVSAIFAEPVADVLQEISDPVFREYAEYRMTHEQTITVDNAWYESYTLGTKELRRATFTPVSETYPAWDKDGDGLLSEDEAAAVKAIDVSKEALEAVGISGTVNSVAAGGYFYSLELLHASYQEIETLNANEFPLLKKLICDHSGLESLSIDKCALLEELFVEHNYLSALSIGKCKNLYKLSCWDNNIDSNDGEVNIDISSMATVDGMYFLRMGAQRNSGDLTLREADDLPQLTRGENESQSDYMARVNEVYGSVVAIMSLNTHNPHWSVLVDDDSEELKFNRNVGWAGW